MKLVVKLSAKDRGSRVGFGYIRTDVTRFQFGSSVMPPPSDDGVVSIGANNNTVVMLHDLELHCRPGLELPG